MKITLKRKKASALQNTPFVPGKRVWIVNMDFDSPLEVIIEKVINNDIPATFEVSFVDKTIYGTFASTTVTSQVLFADYKSAAKAMLDQLVQLGTKDILAACKCRRQADNLLSTANYRQVRGFANLERILKRPLTENEKRELTEMLENETVNFEQPVDRVHRFISDIIT